MILKKIHSLSAIFFRFICGIPSRVIFGNCCSIRNNIIGSKNIYYNNEIAKRGFKVFKYNLNKEIIDKISIKASTYFNDNQLSRFNENDKKKDIYEPLSLIPELKELTKIIDQEIKSYYQSDYLIKRVRVWRIFSDLNSAKKESYLYSNFWHFDDYRTDKLNAFILLNDGINRNTGSTKIISTSDTKKIVRSFKFIDTSISNEFINNYVVKNNIVNYFEGNKGDILLANVTRCLHSASIPDKTHFRDVAQFEIYKNKNKNDKIFQIEKDVELFGDYVAKV